ncbi:disease resistance protein Roq1-like [Lotus japonicus]|uniref:disease resistance protein Roq1-like n=1 Tax=Lotus japonicus TaxID=34305 RepID=UPI002590DA10|nr:disease resistance protein Roq1-like [Lotus japonicus]
MEKGRAESSSSFKHEWTYDVFLSFRGEDTRFNITGNIYNSLVKKGIHTFMDDEELRKGKKITPALLKAIQKSRIAIIIFSKNYASSTYCLDELVEILKLVNAEGRLVLPVFYDVDPSLVRHQRGTYSEAMAKHEERFPKNKGKVQKWRGALREAADLSGWHFQNGSESEYKLIDKIVEEVSKKINRVPLHVVDNPVDLDSAVLQVSSLLGLGSEVIMVGIYGFGGQGKTTIARAVYNLIADQFESLCFLADIRETAIGKLGLVQLQETLLSEILGEKDIKVGNVNQGIPIIKRSSIEGTRGGIDWFGSGSKIIITTRDKQLLNSHGVVRLHEVKLLSHQKALELFSWHAFKSHEVKSGYVKISKRAVSYARGLPLALEVIGSHLCDKSLDECKSALDKYEKVPHQDIHEILKVSFDGLGDDEKGIFLDIACFFNKGEVEYVKQMLHAHGFHAEDGIRVLAGRSLIKIDSCVAKLRMHALVQDMGREIVRQESIREPGGRSRLWFDEDIIHVLEENTGTEKVELIMLDGCKNKEVQCSGKAFMKMKNLRILVVDNAVFSTGPKRLPNSLKVLSWNCYPSQSLPSDFNPKQLEMLHMRESCLEFFQPPKMLKTLTVLYFEKCKFLTELPSLSGATFLKKLSLDNCTKLVKVHDSVGFLKNLHCLSAKGCTQLENLVPCIKLASLEILDLQGCSRLKRFPEVLGKMKKIREINLDKTAIDKLPLSIGNLIGLEQLSIKKRGKHVIQLPDSIHALTKVVVVTSDKPQGFRFFRRSHKNERLGSEISPSSMLVYQGARREMSDFTTFDVYYSFMSPNNVIEVCIPMPLVHHDFEMLFPKMPTDFQNRLTKSSMCFSFRKKFPRIALCYHVSPNSTGSLMSDFKFSVLINGAKQFSSSCACIAHSTRGLIFWCDLQSKVDEVFTEHDWNEVEIQWELNKQKSNSKSGTMDDHWEGNGCLCWTLIGLYKKGNNKQRVKFENPTSDFPLPCCSPTTLLHAMGHQIKLQSHVLKSENEVKRR